ncbi:hypothetical protein ACFFHH_14425 [Cytobacillus solani]|uniref:Peptidylprolyl isomerase n=1 Tax=Cytobacillus solani TaxID=1637975 RepID=A0A0Q3VK11_9BACI|nr:hypothetical protein [Cytobacillus solani]KOP71738.1 hypothetical protein AMS60_20770 [Bacillus sp. FJAT-21945]KQL21587.1 hypothetical protein AN957_25535 [Cytobacillus solani]USK54897.1 hypothetical protein LIS82_25710 [Cytobacillus solani]
MCKKRLFTTLLILIVCSFLAGCQINAASNPSEEKKSDTGNEDVSMEKLTNEDKVVTINGMVYTYADLKFFELMSKVEIELNRLQDQQSLTGKELEDKLKYWDEQIKYHDNYNVNLSKMIEQNSMYLLAEEKGLKVDEQVLQKKIDDFTQKVDQAELAKKLIEASSSDEYNTQLNTYFKQRVLTEEIYNILKEDVKKENPDAAEQEISYLTDKKYEELYMSQMESLNLTIETP